ncbi:hypothetical protein A3Q56_07479, partial [Intoshia linei]
MTIKNKLNKLEQKRLLYIKSEYFLISHKNKFQTALLPKQLLTCLRLHLFESRYNYYFNILNEKKQINTHIEINANDNQKIIFDLVNTNRLQYRDILQITNNLVECVEFNQKSGSGLFDLWITNYDKMSILSHHLNKRYYNAQKNNSTRNIPICSLINTFNGGTDLWKNVHKNIEINYICPVHKPLVNTKLFESFSDNAVYVIPTITKYSIESSNMIDRHINNIKDSQINFIYLPFDQYIRNFNNTIVMPFWKYFHLLTILKTKESVSMKDAGILTLKDLISENEICGKTLPSKNSMAEVNTLTDFEKGQIMALKTENKSHKYIAKQIKRSRNVVS